MRIAHVVSTFPPYRGGQGNVARELAERTAARGHDVVVVTPYSLASSRAERADSERSRGISISGTNTDRFSHVRPILRLGNAAWCPSIARTLEELQPDLVHLHWPFIGGIAPVIAWRRGPPLPLAASHGERGSWRGRGGMAQANTPLPPAPSLSPREERRGRGAVERRLVVQYHMDLIGEGWRGALFAAYQRRALPRVLAAADRVVVSSLDYARHGALAPYVAQLGERLSEIPLGVDIERFTLRPHPPTPPAPTPSRSPSGRGRTVPEEGGETTKNFSPSRSEGEREGEGLHALFVGGLDRAHAFKGLSGLLEAIWKRGQAPFPMGPDPFSLRIVGDGGLRSRYEQLTRQLGVADRVEFLGSVSDAELPGIYRNADILVLPSTSRSEAFGVVLLEACAAGIPVIASDLPGVRTVVVDGETGFLVPPGDVAALAQRLAMFARDPEKMREMGAVARRRMEERYAWDHVMDAWDACYRSL